MKAKTSHVISASKYSSPKQNEKSFFDSYLERNKNHYLKLYWYRDLGFFSVMFYGSVFVDMGAQ